VHETIRSIYRISSNSTSNTRTSVSSLKVSYIRWTKPSNSKGNNKKRALYLLWKVWAMCKARSCSKTLQLASLLKWSRRYFFLGSINWILSDRDAWRLKDTSAPLYFNNNAGIIRELHIIYFILADSFGL